MSTNTRIEEQIGWIYRKNSDQRLYKVDKVSLNRVLMVPTDGEEFEIFSREDLFQKFTLVVDPVQDTLPLEQKSKLAQWITQYTKSPCTVDDIWAFAVQDSFQMGGKTPEGVQVVEAMADLMSRGQVQTSPFFEFPEIELAEV